MIVTDTILVGVVGALLLTGITLLAVGSVDRGEHGRFAWRPPAPVRQHSGRHAVGTSPWAGPLPAAAPARVAGGRRLVGLVAPLPAPRTDSGTWRAAA